jgi:hypothetical protein
MLEALPGLIGREPSPPKSLQKADPKGLLLKVKFE